MKTKIHFSLLKWLLSCLLSFTFIQPTVAKCPYSPVTFTASFVDSGYLFYNSGKIDLPVKFDFGDGQTFYGVRPKNGIFHKYTQNGQYKVTMYYNDTVQYCKDTSVQYVCFFKLGDSITFRKSNDTLYAEAPFHNNAFYRWSYGDNTFGKGFKSWHVYQKSGYYYPQLLFVTDTLSGCQYYYPTKYQVMEFTKCGFIADFYNEKNYSVQPLRLKAIVVSTPFSDSKKKMNGRETWYWGDGTSTTQNKIELDKDTHFYATRGNYNICHVIEDSSGCKDSLCNFVEVDSCNAYAFFTYTVNDREVSFNVRAAGSIDWYIDGKKVLLNKAKYLFSANGTYNVCLKAVGSENCSVEYCTTITVFKCERIDLNKITWQENWNDCYTLEFNNSNTNFNKFKWDFGDNSTSSDKDPVHVYGQNAIYKLKLVAKDTLFNCQDSIEFLLSKFCCNIKDSLKVINTSNHSATIQNHSYIKKPKGPVHKHKWIFDGVKVYNTAFPTHTFTSKGFHQVIYIAYDTIANCTDSFNLYILVDSADEVPYQINVTNTSGIKDVLHGGSLLVFPNPANDQVKIKGLEELEITEIIIYDILGNKYSAVWNTEEDVCKIDLPDSLNSGLYFINIITAQGAIMVKVFKE